MANDDRLYFRFGKIPKNDRCSIWAGGKKKIGEEKGVSCYEAHLDRHGRYIPVPPSPLTEKGWDTYHGFMHYDWSQRAKYIVKGDFVGYGTDNEPLLRNVKIIRQIKREKP